MLSLGCSLPLPRAPGFQGAALVGLSMATAPPWVCCCFRLAHRQCPLVFRGILGQVLFPFNFNQLVQLHGGLSIFHWGMSTFPSLNKGGRKEHEATGGRFLPSQLVLSNLSDSAACAVSGLQRQTSGGAPLIIWFQGFNSYTTVCLSPFSGNKYTPYCSTFFCRSRTDLIIDRPSESSIFPSSLTNLCMTCVYTLMPGRPPPLWLPNIWNT